MASLPQTGHSSRPRNQGHTRTPTQQADHSTQSPASAPSHASTDYADTNTSSSAGPTPPSTTNGSSHNIPYQYTTLTPEVIHQHGVSHVVEASYPQMAQQRPSTAHPLPMQRFQAPSPYPYARHNDYQPLTVSVYDTTPNQPRQRPQAPSSVSTPAATQSRYHNTNVAHHVPQHQPYGSTTLVSKRQTQEQVLRGVGTQFYGHGTHNGRGGQ